ncbi:type IVB secretion system protein IcmH/DotU [Sessilibacter sp. MAH4]
MSDQTVIVPTPGGSRGPSSNRSTSAEMPSFESAKVSFSTALNPIIFAATKLLNVIVKLRTEISHQDVKGLHQKLGQELNQFHQSLKQQGIDDNKIFQATYLMCTVIDETVLNTPWGANSPWSSHSLLSIFHKETFGGERCFVMLQQLLQAPGSNLDLLELNYICLSLGFKGKFALNNRGHEQLEQIRDNLYYTIEKHKPEFHSDLSSHWQGLNTKGKSLTQYIPIWVILTCALLVLVLIYTGFRVWIYNDTQPTTEIINKELSETVVTDETRSTIESR